MAIFTDPVELNQNILDQLQLSLKDYWSQSDILQEMMNITQSVIPIVQNANLELSNDLRANVILESGIKFPNSDTPNVLQTTPYLEGAIDHSKLLDLDQDVHTQYLARSGARIMTGNIGISSWINSIGLSNAGISFINYHSLKESLVLASNTKLVFDNDNSTLETAGGSAEAWISFDSSQDPLVVRSSFNIKSLQKLSTGQYKIMFQNEIKDGYIVLSSANGSSLDEASLCSSACSKREREYVTMAVQDLNNQYVNSKYNDLVVYSIS